MGATVEMNEAFLHFRRAFRTARAAVQADAEAYMEVVRVVESLGAYLEANCAGRTPDGLGKALEIIRSVLFPDPDAWLGSSPREPSVAALFERLLRVRNTTVHEGALSRSAGIHAVRLSLAIEEALMVMLKEDTSVLPWMVPDPIVAKSWHTISHIREKLLSGGFNALPLWRDDTWHFVRDVAVVDYLRAKGKDFRCRLHLTLSKAVGDTSPPLELTPADQKHCVAPDAKLSDLLKTGWPAGDLPVLVVDKNNRLVGVLTPHDLLV